MELTTIVAGGTIVNTEKLMSSLENSDYIIAADCGYDILHRISKFPDIIIGDMDSIKNDISKCKSEIHRKDKSLSDTELALKHALALQPDKIEIHGANGNYLDHTLANLELLFKYYNNEIPIVIITDNSRVYAIEKRTKIINKNGHRCSFFIKENVKNLELSGFEYIFKKKDLTKYDFSLSNVIKSDEAEIKFDKGRVLLIIYDEGYK